MSLNPYLDEINGLSDGAKEALKQAHSLAAGGVAGGATGTQPAPTPPVPPMQPQGMRMPSIGLKYKTAPTEDAGMLNTRGPAMPKIPTPQTPESVETPSLPAVGPSLNAPTPSIPQAMPRYAGRGSLEGDKEEQARLRHTGSGISQIHSKIENSDFGQRHPTLGKIAGWGAEIPARIADIGVSSLLPAVAMNTPGTEYHHRMLENRAGAAVAADEAGAQKEAATAATQAEVPLRAAQTAEHQANVPLKAAEAKEHEAKAEAALDPTAKTAFQQWMKQNPDGTVEDWLKLQAGNKPDTSTALKKKFMETVSKVADEGHLPMTAMSDVKQLGSAIVASSKLTPQEKNDALGYLAANTTPAAQGTNTTIRVEGMQAARENPVINKKTGALEIRSSDYINAHPDLYAPAGEGAKSMSKESLFQDLHFNINKAREAIAGLDDMDAGTRAQLAYALRQSDPKSSLSAFMTSSIGTNLDEKQQNAVIALASLAENSMVLRQIGGMGQGSDELRSAILATIPSGRTPSKGYAQKQLNQFESVVSRLEKGVAKSGTNQAPTDNKSGGTIQARDPQGKLHEAPAGTELPKGWTLEKK